MELMRMRARLFGFHAMEWASGADGCVPKLVCMVLLRRVGVAFDGVNSRWTGRRGVCHHAHQTSV